MKFEWDPQKNRGNITKHGVDFSDVWPVFADPFLLSVPDQYHSEIEDRWISIGENLESDLLTIVHTYAPETENRSEMVRIISARKSTSKERRIYFERKER